MRVTLALLLVLLATPGEALTTYYVAPNSTTAHTGAAATPWVDLASGISTINTTLASDDVTVYFTARKAASDTNETTTTPLTLTRTDTSTHRLTLDGMSQYSSSNSSPSWSAYAGTSRFQITASLPVDPNNGGTPWPQRNYITIRGFKLVSAGGVGQGLNLTGMSNVIAEYNDVSVSSSSPSSSMVFTGLSCNDKATCTNWGSHIIIRNNTLHDSNGECIYIGGTSADPPGDGSATNSGDDILIQSNTITDCGRYGGQGDGIDVKDGHTNLRIINNVIRLTHNDFAATDNQCIVVESADLIDGNFCEGRGILTSAAWNTQLGRSALIIRNNIIVNVTFGQGNVSSGGIELGEATSSTYQWSATGVYNNSIYLPGGNCIEARTPHPSNVVENNICHTSRNGLNGIAANAAGLITTHDYNLFYNLASGNALSLNGVTTTCAGIAAVETHSLCADPSFVSTGTPYNDINFRLQGASPAVGAGLNLSATFTTDYGGATRSVPWNLGAWASVPAGGLGAHPKGVLTRPGIF